MSVDANLCYLDANCLIIALEADDAAGAPARRLIEAARVNPGLLKTSELSLAEIMAGVEKRRDQTLRDAYFELLENNQVIELIPVSREALLRSARLRAEDRGKLNLADAIHLATAIGAKCRYFVTDDRRIRPPPHGPALARPDDRGIAKILESLNAL